MLLRINMYEERFNVDFPTRISELEKAMNKLKLKWIIYQIIFRGKGLEFDSYRDYNYSDDASLIDWKASLRTNKLLVKKYIEERDLNIMFVIDSSDNMVFGSAKQLKCEYCAEIAASLSHLSLLSGDKIGFCFLNNYLKKIVYPASGKRQFNVFSFELTNIENYGGKPPKLDDSLEYLLELFGEKVDVVFILSDFLNLGLNFHKNYSIFSFRYETIPIIIRDPLDENLPDIDSEFFLEDPISGKQIIINPRVVKKQYVKKVKEEKDKLIKIFEECGTEYLEIKTTEPFIPLLIEFLIKRAKRRKENPKRK
ncbi:MAG: DUF58 domain-containing protein [Candidatus Pacearchaeota archaeon]